MKMKETGKWVGLILCLTWAISCGGGGGLISTTPGEELVASIRILSPLSGTSLSGISSIIVEVIDAQGNTASRVDLWMGTPGLPVSMVPYENSHLWMFQWDTTGYPNGAVNLEVKAYGRRGSLLTPQEPGFTRVVVNILNAPTGGGGQVNHPPVILRAGVGDTYQTDVSGIAPVRVNFKAQVSDPDPGDAISYHWEFGHGGNFSTQASPSYSYPQGNYTAVLTVVDSRGLASLPSPPIFIRASTNLPPVASILASLTGAEGSFSPNPISEKGTPNLTVYFRGIANDPDGGNVTYFWDFGDGGTDTSQNPTHTFGIGTYVATLGVTDDENTPSPIASLLIRVYPSPPPRVNARGSTDGFSYSEGPLLVQSGKPVYFKADASDDDGQIVSVLWDFADGTTASVLIPPPHFFTIEKTYIVTFSAIDNDGLSSSDSIQVTVGAAVPSPVTQFSCTMPTPASVKCTWNDVAGEQGYRLQRQQSPDPAWNALASIPPDSTEYTDSTVTAGVPYGYRIIAYNAYGDSLPSPVSRVGPAVFVDATTFSGVTIGDRVAWADCNNDGFVDLYSSGNLFRNNGNGTFSSAGSLPGGHPTFGDFDNDGNVDLFLAGPDVLLRNTGNCNFQDVTAASGINDTSPTEAAAWGDCNNDGFLDLYLANYEVWQDNDATFYPDKLFKNNGNGSFSDITSQAGINDLISEYNTPAAGRAVTWADYDNDGDQDIYVSNYRLHPNYLWRNSGNCSFTDVARQAGVAGRSTVLDGTTYWGHTIGSSWGDFNNDGYLDLFSATLHHLSPMPDGRPFPGDDNNNLWKNNGPSGWDFADVYSTSGIRFNECDAGGMWGDYDNDGDLDLLETTLYYANGCDRGGRIYLYQNDGNGLFTDRFSAVGLSGSNTYTAAWADYDNDGLLDAIIGGKLFHNDTNSNNWLEIRLKGSSSNKSAIGAIVKLTAGGLSMTRVVESASGAANANMLTLHFGLGAAQQATVDVRWPSGRTSQLPNVTVNQILEITE